MAAKQRRKSTKGRFRKSGLALRMVQAFIGLWILAAFASANSDNQSPAASSAGEYALGGAQTCLTCHGERSFMPATAILQSSHAMLANPDSVGADNHQCQSCHGPSAAHVRGVPGEKRPPPAIVFDADSSAETTSRVCLDCHSREVGSHWAGSLHQFGELACRDCHQLHAARDPVRQRQAQAEVCFDCHRQQKADFFRPSTHPVREGLQTCSDCHQVHGSAGIALLKHANTNDTCYECHAEKRGPFLWEHAPVREDCSNCHRPHGSNHPALLQARTPFLCQQCHLAPFHPSTAIEGSAQAPFGSSHLLLGKDCMNCHSQIHGSNHPSGPGLVR